MDQHRLTAVSKCWFTSAINGIASGFFKSGRGLRQGDPLSPTIFVVLMEVLSRSLNSMGGSPRYNIYYTMSGCPMVTHLTYADDVLLFSAGDKYSVAAVMRHIVAYERGSGQRVNKRKSNVYVHHWVSEERRAVLRQITGV